RRLTDRLTRWLIYHQRADLTMQQRIDAYQGQVQALLPRLTEMFIGDTKKAFEAERDRLIRAGFPQEVAVNMARMFGAFSVLDIVVLNSRMHVDSRLVAGVFFLLHDETDVSSFLGVVTGLSRRGRWAVLSRVSMREVVYAWLTDLPG